MRLNRSEVDLETFPALFIEISNLRNMLDNPLFRGDVLQSHMKKSQTALVK